MYIFDLVTLSFVCRQSGVDLLTEAPDAILLHSLPLRRGGTGAVNALLDSDRCMVRRQSSLWPPAAWCHCA